MDYCLNIDTNKYQSIKKINSYNYTFLNNLSKNNVNINIFYDILNSYEIYKLKNIYNFLYKRIFKLDIENINYKNTLNNINSDELDSLLSDYIDTDIKLIVIMNSIQQYYHPLM
jgi:hypothetical protein